MKAKEAEELFAKGLEALENDHVYLARTCLEQASELDESAEISSYLALCRAKTRGQFTEAIKMAEAAVAVASANPQMHLNLAKIYLLADNKELALQTLREGMPYDSDNKILNELEKHGNRKASIFPAFKRNNPINKFLGILLSRLKLR